MPSNRDVFLLILSLEHACAEHKDYHSGTRADNEASGAKSSDEDALALIQLRLHVQHTRVPMPVQLQSSNDLQQTDSYLDRECICDEGVEQNVLLTNADDHVNHTVNVSISPLIEKEEQKSMFSDIMKEVTASPSIDSLKLNGGLVMAHYHKTGCEFTRQFQKILQEVNSFIPKAYKDREVRDLPHGGTSHGKFFQENLSIPLNTIAKVANPSMAWNLPLDAPVVHWYREPIDLIMSGYRYHSNEVSAEKWEKRMSTLIRVDKKAYNAIFSSCGFQCSYLQLLKSVSEQQGVILESLMERQELQNMVVNLQRWGNNPQVLHVTMEHLETDFSLTMKCIIKFYGIDESSTLLEELNTLYRPPGSNDPHVTSGKHDNTKLRILLEQHPTWGREFEKLKGLSKSIYSRQNKMYGCPMPL
eukprot:gnl/MRDRNA2_/MRDRNA2_31417_c0_seq1.p1 gnl/MRDRNA2_/MRDRNA2_31417_c0~~gnl/MRDRNA2_/MRDRNA2_31417_c0_seq1.p1  ORF type:complete len:416 (+),score=69.15 gnl/MRDRNA2_/MRDRNA2_31417_c0_seq1:97-1344(+)